MAAPLAVVVSLAAVVARPRAAGASEAEAAALAPWPDDAARTASPVAPALALDALALDTLDGGRIDLAAYRGRVVLVHFFATWCEPCREEMASLARLAIEAAGGDLVVLAVDVGEVDVRVRRFFAAEPVPFPVLLDRDRATARAWGVSGLPTTIVLDRALAPRLVVRRDLDWNAPAVVRSLRGLTAAPVVPAEASPGGDPDGLG